MKPETYTLLNEENQYYFAQWEGYSIICIKDIEDIKLKGNVVSMNSKALSFTISKCSNDALDPDASYQCESPEAIDEYIK